MTIKKRLLTILVIVGLSWLSMMLTLTTLTTANEVSKYTSAAKSMQFNGIGHLQPPKTLSLTGVLLIPDSGNDRIMAFDFVTGDLIEENFIVDAAHLDLPINAILSADGERILVADQIKGVVQEYDLFGNYIGVFVSLPGPNSAILSSIHGISLGGPPNNDLLVTVGSGANADAVARFDKSGNYLGNLITNTAGGLDAPFDIYMSGETWLVSAGNSDAIHRYTLTGTYIATLTNVASAPRQIAKTAEGHILVANRSGDEAGILRYRADGVLLNRYDPITITGGHYYGVYELPNGNILTTNDNGVYEIDRNGNLIDTKISGNKINARYIEFVPITITRPGLVYLPLLFKNYCHPFVYNEILPYNLKIIEASAGWRCKALSNDVVVAIIDTGVDLDHPDLQANIVPGKTFVSGTSTPNDDHVDGHGSHVAGIVAGVGNNDNIIGVAPHAKIMPVKVIDSEGKGDISDVADGVIWASNNGARIINMSLGTVSTDGLDALLDALNYAQQKGVLIVAAAGNCGNSSYNKNGCAFQNQPNYPAALPMVIAVASTNAADERSSFSNQNDYVEIAAPGSDIYSADKAGGYMKLSGTSQATPHVAGLAALIWSKYPTLTNEQVRAHIINTAKDLGPLGGDEQFGYGRIDVAVASDTSPPTTVASPPPRVNTLSSTTLLSGGNNGSFVPGELLVKLRPGADLKPILTTFRLNTNKVQIIDTIPEIAVRKLSVPVGQEKVILEKLKAANDVVYVTLNYYVSLQ